MKILILISSLQPGGAEKQAIIDANLLADSGHSVTIVYGIDGPLISLLNHNIKKISLDTINKFKAQIVIARILTANKYDILHAHMFWAEKVSALPARLTRTRLIFNEHGLGLWKKWYHKIEMRCASSMADLVVCSCELNLEIRQINNEVHPAKLAVLLNSIDNDSYKKIDTINWRKRIIGFVGRFHAVKQVEHFVKLANELARMGTKDFIFLLVGDGDEKSRICDMIKNEKLESKFELVGYQDNTPKYYQKMSLFVLPSRIEALSVALIEAQSHGIPCLAYDVGGNKEVVIDHYTGYLAPLNDISALANKINGLLSDEQLWQTMSLNAYNNARRSFSQKTRLRKLIEIYQR